jgi:hypothetical protein
MPFTPPPGLTLTWLGHSTFLIGHAERETDFDRPVGSKQSGLPAG